MQKEKIKLISKKDICDGVAEFEFTKPADFNFKVGQYVNLYIPESKVAHGKSYTIVSAPQDETLRFSIRRRGPFSQHLHNLEIGNEMILEGPEGIFSFEEYDEGVIFIAAGIGIAPLISYLRYLEQTKQFDKKIEVLFSNKTKFSTPYFNELSSDKNFKKLNTKFFYTADGGQRIDKSSVEKLIKNNGLPIFICGSINFTNDFWKMLLDLGIDDDRMVTEAFF